MTPSAILCVDDEPLILLSLKMELKSHFQERYLYETSSSAEEAFDVITELEAEGVQLILVISDWQMPGMRGDEFLHQVRLTHPAVHTVLITGHATPEALDRVRNDHLADLVLIKPWKTDVLIRAIEELVPAEGPSD
jgi:CheY-like chemotaxis protein